MKRNFLIIILSLIFTSGLKPNELYNDFSENVDTIQIIKRNNNLYFSKSIFGVSHIHFIGKGMKCIDLDSFSKDSIKLTFNMILSNMYGIHEIPLETLERFKINDIECSNTLLFQPDTSTYHTNAVIFNSYFEDVVIEVDNENGILIANNVITYIPERCVKYDVVFIGKRPFIIAKTNIGGVLYTEWFGFDACRHSTFYRASRYTFHGIGTGAKEAARGTSAGFKEATRGAGIGGKEAARGLGIAAESTTTSIGQSVYNESKMFYKPSREFEDMSDFDFHEKSIIVEEGVTIYTYFFESISPKANIFLVHGNGGNVSTYKSMIKTLVSGNYNVYTVDWRGYGKSTGTPEYKGVLKDTEIAFDDFISQFEDDSLKIIVYGMSLGGQIATKLASGRLHNIDALILDGSLSSAQNLAIDFMPAEFIRNNMRKNVEMFNQDYVAEEDIKKITSIPKLIIHSEVDKIVKFYHGERLFENAPEPKFFWKTNTHHIKTLEELPEDAINKIDCFFLTP